MNKPFQKTSPCGNCPWRVDAPLKHWNVVEFTKTIFADEAMELGSTFGCHKNDGNMCVGFMMDQVRRDLPSIEFRLSLLKHKVTSEYLDNLTCKSGIYSSVRQMCLANYPENFKHLKNLDTGIDAPGENSE